MSEPAGQLRKFLGIHYDLNNYSSYFMTQPLHSGSACVHWPLLLTQGSGEHLVSPSGLSTPFATVPSSPEDTEWIQHGASQHSVSLLNKRPDSSISSSSSCCSSFPLLFPITFPSSSSSNPLLFLLQLLAPHICQSVVDSREMQADKVTRTLCTHTCT